MGGCVVRRKRGGERERRQAEREMFKESERGRAGEKKSESKRGRDGEYVQEQEGEGGREEEGSTDR
eukprot:92352-Rhodomonas_salina.1